MKLLPIFASFLLVVSGFDALSALADTGNSKENPELASYGSPTKCTTQALVFEMKPRAPLPGETAEVYEQSGTYFLPGKVDVTVTDKKTRKVLTRFVAEDNFDPWEASYAAFYNESVSFHYLNEGSSQPSVLQYQGKELASEATCE